MDNTYYVDQEDGVYYVYDPEGRPVANYDDEDEAQGQADKLNSAKYVDRVEEAAARADYLYDQMRDRQMFGKDS